MKKICTILFAAAAIAMVGCKDDDAASFGYDVARIHGTWTMTQTLVEGVYTNVAGGDPTTFTFSANGSYVGVGTNATMGVDQSGTLTGTYTTGTEGVVMIHYGGAEQFRFKIASIAHITLEKGKPVNKDEMKMELYQNATSSNRTYFIVTKEN